MAERNHRAFPEAALSQRQRHRGQNSFKVWRGILGCHLAQPSEPTLLLFTKPPPLSAGDRGKKRKKKKKPQMPCLSCCPPLWFPWRGGQKQVPQHTNSQDSMKAWAGNLECAWKRRCPPQELVGTGREPPLPRWARFLESCQSPSLCLCTGKQSQISEVLSERAPHLLPSLIPCLAFSHHPALPCYTQRAQHEGEAGGRTAQAPSKGGRSQ